MSSGSGEFTVVGLWRGAVGVFRGALWWGKTVGIFRGALWRRTVGIARGVANWPLLRFLGNTVGVDIRVARRILRITVGVDIGIAFTRRCAVNIDFRVTGLVLRLGEVID